MHLVPLTMRLLVLQLDQARLKAVNEGAQATAKTLGDLQTAIEEETNAYQELLQLRAYARKCRREKN